MRTSAKLVLAALTAAIVLASAVGTASARNLSTSKPSFSVSWSSLQFVTSVATVTCRITLEGSFHSRTIPKVARALIGTITRAIFARFCTTGEAWADNGSEAEPLGTAPNRLPWHLTYEFFTGSLPNIGTLGFLLSRFSYVIQAVVMGISARCRYGNATDNVNGSAAREASGGITSLAPVAGRNTASLVEGLLNSVLCPGSMSLTGTSGAPPHRHHRHRTGSPSP